VIEEGRYETLLKEAGQFASYVQKGKK